MSRFIQSKKYVCYHILPKDGKPGKVGATENCDQRVITQQVGKSAKYGTDWVVLRENDDMQTISDTEVHFQKLFGYPLDKSTFAELKQMNKYKGKKKKGFTQEVEAPVEFFLSNNKSWYSVYYTSSLTELLDDISLYGIKLDGVVYTEGEIKDLFFGAALQKSRWDGFFIASRVVDGVLGNMEMTTAHTLWAENPPSTEILPEGTIDRDAMWEEALAEQDAVTKRQQNKCSDLEIPELGDVTLNTVFEMQKKLQQQFPETRTIGNQSISATAKAAQRNLHAFLDEVMEYMDALGGINDGYGNGAWKYWKDDNKIAQRQKLTALSAADMKELKMEYVDMFHFFINWGLMIGMTGDEVLQYYVAKNAENFDRQKRGY